MGGASLGAQLISQRYGREAERESDEYGIQYMVRAGYDPRGAITLQEKFVALSKARGENAMQKLARASGILPQEAKFHGLRGDILREQHRYREAIESYDAALSRNDRYFVYHLGRGVANARLGNTGDVQRDLKRSMDFLPTAYAALELGNLAMVDNDRDAAKAYYRSAAQSGGDTGQRAGAAFVRLISRKIRQTTSACKVQWTTRAVYWPGSSTPVACPFRT